MGRQGGWAPDRVSGFSLPPGHLKPALQPHLDRCELVLSWPQEVSGSLQGVGGGISKNSSSSVRTSSFTRQEGQAQLSL